MNAYEYAIARVATQIRTQPEKITKLQWKTWAILMECVLRYKWEGK